MGTLTVDCDTSKVSDGYHTFAELYDHRCHLFAALMRSNLELSWRSRLHADGGSFGPDWFVAGMHLPSGDITYHLPAWMWSMLDDLTTLDRAPEWDGHSPADVVARLAAWNSPSYPVYLSDILPTPKGERWCNKCGHWHYEVDWPHAEDSDA